MIEIMSSSKGYSESIGFHWADYLIFSLTIAISLGVGLYTGLMGQTTTEDYLLGSKKLQMIPVALSIFMSAISGILILGNSAEMYFYGTQAWVDCLGRAVFSIISANLFVPLLYGMRLTSVYEVRETFSFREVHMYFKTMHLVLLYYCSKLGCQCKMLY